MKRDITVKQDKFIGEYVKDGNGTRAALEAYDTEDYNTAAAIAYENLNKPQVRKRVDEALQALKITPQVIIARFNKQALKYEDINPNAAVRANEQLAHIADLYPSQSNSVDIGDGHIKISWGGSDIPLNE